MARYQHLLDLSRRMQGVSSYEELVRVASDAMWEHTRYRHAWLTLFDVERQMARWLGGVGRATHASTASLQMLEFSIADDAMVSEILRSHEPVIVEDARRDPRPDPDAAKAFGSCTIVNIPLLFDNATLGCFGFGTLVDVGVMVPTEAELDFLSGVAGQMSVVIGRLRAEEARRTAEARLLRAQRLEAMGLLAGGVAHDFNNLLTAVFCNLELARAELDPDSVGVAYLDDVHAAAARGAALSRQLLAFARRQVVQPRPVDLNALLDGVRPLIRRGLPSSITIEVVVSDEVGNVLADPGQVEQVLLNLAINARDAMPDGGHLRIETENVTFDEASCRSRPWARPGRFASITVADSGEGMPEEVLPHIFEPFFTTKGEGGSGLGLSVVHGIIEQHDGMVRVHSAVGLGTSFAVYLPIVEREAVASTPVEDGPVRGGAERIVVAEDDAQVRRVVGHMLLQAGYHVTLVADGARALEHVDEAARAGRPVDLVLSDVVMPNLDGAALWARLQERHPGLPVLIMSGYAARGLSSRFGEHHDLRILDKPFQSRQLLLRVREVLDRSARGR